MTLGISLIPTHYMKNYKLQIFIRNGLESRHLSDVTLDTTHFEQFIQIKELSVFNPQSYLTFSLQELPTPEDIE